MSIISFKRFARFLLFINMGKNWLLILFAITLLLSNSSAGCPGDPGCTCSDVSDCETGTYCPSGTCAKCNTDTHCSTQHPVRGKCSSSKYCTQCLTNADCPSGTTCRSDFPYLCGSNSGCNSDSQCPTDRPHCVNTNSWGGSGKYCFACEVDRDCKLWKGGSLPYCIGGTCKECKSNSDCGSVSASACVSNACTACTSSADCSHLTATPFCKLSGATGQCVECLSSDECITVAKSRCSSAGSCVACSNNNDCTKFSSTPVCSTSTSPNKCAQCGEHSDCPSTTASKCSSGSCTSCTAHSHCERFSSTPKCSGGQCVECVANNDCTSVSASRCSGTNTCATCMASTDCTQFNATGTTLCSTILNQCVKCLANSNCTSVSASKCDSSTGSCTTCVENTDCERLTSTPFCSTTLSKCVACLMDTDCPSVSASKCSPTTGTCTTCSVNDDCHFALTPFCSTTLLKCVECLSNNDCTSVSTSKCSATTGTCTSCTEDSDCSTTPATPMCSTTLSKCVECLTDTDCDSVSAPKCSSSSGSCTACTQDSDCHFTETPACSSSSVCVSVCTKYQTQCTSCSNGLYLLNDTCLSTCPSGYTANRNTNACDETTNAELIATVESMADASSTGASVASAAMLANVLRGAGGANLLGSAFGAQMVIFCKFMNITYPDHVMVFFNSSNPISLSIPIDLQIFTSDYYPEDSEINQINDNGNLEYFEVSQYVYDNVLDQVATLLLTIIVTGLVYAAANFRCFQRAYSERAKNIIKQADILISNFVIMAVFSNTLEVVFYSLLNLYYPTIYTRFGWMNFVSSIVFVILILIYFVWSIIKLRKIYLLKRGTQSKPSIHLTSKDRTSKDNISSSKLENSFVKERSENHDLKNDEVIDEFSEMPKVKCLHEEYKSDSLVQQMYIPVTFVRAFLFSLNLVIFPDSPQWQSIAALTIHCCYFAYMVILRPVKNKFEFIMGIFFEISVIGVTTCVVGLAVVTKRDDFLDHLDLWNNFGWAIVGFNFMLIGGSLILTIASVFQTAIQVYQLIKLFIEKRKRKRLQKAAIEFSPQQDSFTNKDLDRQDSIQLAPFDLSNANSDNILNDTINQSTFIKSSPIPPLQQYLNNKGSIIQSNERPSRTTISWVMGQDLKTTFEKIDGKPLSSSPVSISPTPTNQPSEQMSHQAALEDGTSLSKKSSFFGESPNKKKKTEKFTSGIRPPEVILQSFVKSRNKDFFSTTK